MTEAAGWQFDIEIHPPGWEFPAGKSWVAGWLWSPQGRIATDLRAWIDGRPFLAIHGLPKQGLEERLLGHPGPPYVGFTILPEPHAGARLLRIEVRDETGAWREIFRTAITVAAGAGSAPVPPGIAALTGSHFATLLRLRAARPAAPWAALADEAISTALAEPLNSLPNPPFHGALEEPLDAGWVRYGRISATGWLAHRHARIVRLTAMIDPLFEVALLHGLKRTDIEGVFADLPGRETSAFLGHVDLPAGSGNPALLKIFADLDNGEKHLVFAQRFTPRVIAGAETALPPLSRLTFVSAAWALLQSARRHHLPWDGWPAFRRALRSAWETYAAEAPPDVRSARVATPPPPPADTGRPLRALVVTHNLNFEGAPWFIYELARHLHALPGSRVLVVSPQEGPLRASFEQAGMTVRVLEVGAALAATSPEGFASELARVTAGLPWDEIDLVIGNTMVAFWAVHAAHQAGKPSLLYIHESSAVRRFFTRHLDSALLPVAEAAFRLAGHVVYTAAATRAVHARLDDRGNGVLLPSWVDVARVDAFAARADRAALRRKHGLDPDAVLLVNIGSLCERKGQHVFIQAAELLKDELRFTYPDKNIQFVMVGARPGLYLEMLQEEVRRLGLETSVRFAPETGEIFDFYCLADIFVCTSFEESFPRVLLESAAFRLPIVSTTVNGIPEMLAENEAWLTPPGDRYHLAEAVKQALAAHFAGDRARAERARAGVLARFHEARSLPRHAALARETAGRRP